MATSRSEVWRGFEGGILPSPTLAAVTSQEEVRPIGTNTRFTVENQAHRSVISQESSRKTSPPMITQLHRTTSIQC
jgi:hypothetical protein